MSETPTMAESLFPYSLLAIPYSLAREASAP
jgi:hypothetical protein